jgi:Mrp family chromosome partitioning ATPase
MKIAFLSVLALATAALAATVPQKAVIVSYPDETPDSVVNQAMDAIREAGGMITHEYRLIK